VIRTLQSIGIVYSRTVESTGSFRIPEDFMRWTPTCHHNDAFDGMAQRFLDKPFYIKNPLLYVWGHSFEFDNQDNWHIIEEFAQYAGGKDDIWYATNIEIYDYVKAYEGLQTSVDKRIVHNPSSVDVWFAHNKQVYCVKAGQTLYL
jgi:hypothetical protein